MTSLTSNVGMSVKSEKSEIKELTATAVRNWVEQMATGEFHYTKVLNGLVYKGSYDKLRKIMYDLCHAVDPIIEPVGKRDGYYRPVQSLPEPVDWVNIGAREDFPVVLPFDLRKYVFIYPNTVIVLAGSKSAGKTGFIYRTVALNMDYMPVILLTNMEGGKEQLRDRFMSMDIMKGRKPNFTVYECQDNFHDFIKQANTLYAIDYIDADPEKMEYYMVGAAITKIRRKLAAIGNSVALVGLQKPINRDIAFGGEGTLKDATLYLAMDKSKLKIFDCKVPADPLVLPNNMAWSFKVTENGTNFQYVKPQQTNMLDE